MKPAFRLVLVVWEDSVVPDSRWVFLDGYEPHSCVQCQSVGWLVREKDGQLVLAPNVGDVAEGQSEQASGIIRIPMRSVTQVFDLAIVNQPVPVGQVEPPLGM